MKNRQIKVVIFIFLDGKKILIEKRILNKFKGLQFLIPGGIVEELEELEDALRREVEEELGITVLEFIPIPSSNIKGLNNQLLIPFLINKWEGNLPNVILDKGNPLEWLPINEVLKTPVKPTLEIVTALKKYLSKKP